MPPSRDCKHVASRANVRAPRRTCLETGTYVPKPAPQTRWREHRPPVSPRGGRLRPLRGPTRVRRRHTGRPIARNAPSCARRHCRSGRQAPGFAREPPWSPRPRSLSTRPSPGRSWSAISTCAPATRPRTSTRRSRRARRAAPAPPRSPPFPASAKTFERGREDIVGFDGAGGGLVEFRQLQRRQQAEAARALLLRDGDGGEVGVFCRGGVRGVAPEQDVATDAVQEGVHVSDAPLAGHFDRSIDRCQRRVQDIPSASSSASRPRNNGVRFRRLD